MMPFPGGLESTANGTLLLSVAAAFVYLPTLARPASLRRTAVKAASVALLAVLVFEAGGSLLLVAALALSAAGDAALAQEDERFHLAGLAGFLAACIAYVVLFLGAGAGSEAYAAEPWRAGAALAAIAFSAVTLKRASGAADALTLTARAGGVLIMVLAALTVPGPWVVLGALSFMASDALGVWEKGLSGGEGDRKPGLPVTRWALYYAAQLSITLATLLHVPQ